MQSHSKQKNTRTSPPITRQASKTKHQSQTTSHKYRKTPPPPIKTSTPTQTLQVSQTDTDFLYETSSQPDNQWHTIVLVPHSQANQVMASEPSTSETNLLDNDINMDVEPLSDSILK